MNNIKVNEQHTLVYVSRTEEHYRRADGTRYIVKLAHIPRKPAIKEIVK